MTLACALIAALYPARVMIARLNGFMNRRQKALHHIVARALSNQGVKFKIIRRVILAVQISVVHLIQQIFHRDELLILPADGRQRRDARLNQQPRFQQLRNQFLLIRKAQAQRVARQPRHGAQNVPCP